MSKIAIIIVNWNTGSLLAGCLRSLVDLGTEEKRLIDEVIVVDNASKDKSVVKAKVVVGQAINQPRVRFLQQSTNIGFAAGNNAGIQKLRERNFTGAIMLLNPDTIVISGGLENMLKVLNEFPRVGIVGAKLLNIDGSVQGSVRPFPKLIDFIYYMLKLGRFRQNRQEQAFDYERAGRVEQVMGAAFLIRGETLRQVGNLDEKFKIWFEEVDYCYRAKAAGWETYFTPRAQVIHYRGVSFSQLLGWRKTVPWIKSSLWYAKKHLGRLDYFILLVLVPVALIITAPAAVWHLYGREKNQKYLKA